MCKRLEVLLQARRRGREHGQRLGEARGGRQALPPIGGWLLRHPNDHWFRRARATVSDPIIANVIDEWIADLAPSYDMLTAAGWAAKEASAGLVIDVKIPQDRTGDWNQLVPVRVLAGQATSADIGSELVMRLVPPGDRSFNGTLAGVLADERWRICGDLLSDGSLLPRDGTRRLSASTT